MRSRGSCKLPELGRTGGGKTWSCSHGQVLVYDIPLYADGWGLHSLVSCLTWGHPVLGSTGSMVALMVTLTGLMPRSPFQHCYCQCLPFHDEPLLTHTSMGPPNTSRQAPFSLYGVTALSLWAWNTQDLVCALHRYSLCFPSPVEYVIKSHWPSKSDSLGFLSLWRLQAGKFDMGLKTFTIVGELPLVLLFSN